MSNIQYGLISETDARALEKTIDLICKEFSDNVINIVEIGLYNCETSTGVMNYVSSKGRLPMMIGIDNGKDKFPPNDIHLKMNYIIGNSNEVYNQLEDNSQHLIFVDGCHCFSCVVSDYVLYGEKVKIGGYFAFHDTGRHIKPFKDFQHGDKNNEGAYISVRKALEYWGAFGFWAYPKHFQGEKIGNGKWELIFDEADETNEAGGITVFKKIA
jgi:hypothetical protein